MSVNSVDHPSPPGVHSVPTTWAMPGLFPVGGAATVPIERSWFKHWIGNNKRRGADLDFFKYGCPEGGVYHSVTMDGCDETLTVTSLTRGATFKPGSSIVVGSHVGGRRKVILGNPPPGEKGKTNFPGLNFETDLSTVIIIKSDPDEVEVGASGVDLTISGIGFSVDLVWTVVVYNDTTLAYESDPNITVNSTAFVSTEEVTMNIDVSGTCPAGHMLTFRAKSI